MIPAPNMALRTILHSLFLRPDLPDFLYVRRIPHCKTAPLGRFVDLAGLDLLSCNLVDRQLDHPSRPYWATRDLTVSFGHVHPPQLS